MTIYDLIVILIGLLAASIAFYWQLLSKFQKFAKNIDVELDQEMLKFSGWSRSERSMFMMFLLAKAGVHLDILRKGHAEKPTSKTAVQLLTGGSVLFYYRRAYALVFGLYDGKTYRAYLDEFNELMEKETKETVEAMLSTRYYKIRS